MSIYQSAKTGRPAKTFWNKYKSEQKDNLKLQWKFGKIYPTAYFTFDEVIDFTDKIILNKLWDPLSFEAIQNRQNRNRARGDYTWILENSVLALATPHSNIPFNFTLSESIPRGITN